jgi:glycosyltransferase involved in cell wall biosynthesis
LTRVGVVINSYERYGAAAGGIVHVLESAKRWSGIEVTVFAPEIARPVVLGALPQAAFVAIPSPDAWTENKAIVFVARIFGALATIVPALRRQDAVYVISPFLPDILPAIAAAPRRTVAQVFHLQKPPGRRAGQFARNVLAYVNERLGMVLVRRFVRSVVVLNDVDTPNLELPATTQTFRVGAGAWPSPVDAAFRSPQTRSGAVCVGRIAPTKGIDDLVDAWTRVREVLPGATLTLVGTGDDPAYLASLRTRLNARGLDDAVRFAGFVSNEAKAEIVGSARIFVTASTEEGWGIAVAEALALGVPCVTYDLPAFREAFPDGRLEVREGDVAGFAEASIALLSDDDRYLELAARARALGATFSWDAVARIEERAIRAVARVR